MAFVVDSLGSLLVRWNDSFQVSLTSIMSRLASAMAAFDSGSNGDPLDLGPLGPWFLKPKALRTDKLASYASFFDRKHVSFTDATENPTEKILQMNSKVINITGRMAEKQLKDWIWWQVMAGHGSCLGTKTYMTWCTMTGDMTWAQDPATDSTEWEVNQKLCEEETYGDVRSQLHGMAAWLPFLHISLDTWYSCRDSRVVLNTIGKAFIPTVFKRFQKSFFQIWLRCAANGGNHHQFRVARMIASKVELMWLSRSVWKSRNPKENTHCHLCRRVTGEMEIVSVATCKCPWPWSCRTTGAVCPPVALPIRSRKNVIPWMWTVEMPRGAMNVGCCNVPPRTMSSRDGSWKQLVVVSKVWRTVSFWPEMQMELWNLRMNMTPSRTGRSGIWPKPKLNRWIRKSWMQRSLRSLSCWRLART